MWYPNKYKVELIPLTGESDHADELGLLYGTPTEPNFLDLLRNSARFLFMFICLLLFAQTSPIPEYDKSLHATYRCVNEEHYMFQHQETVLASYFT